MDMQQRERLVQILFKAPEMAFMSPQSMDQKHCVIRHVCLGSLDHADQEIVRGLLSVLLRAKMGLLL